MKLRDAIRGLTRTQVVVLSVGALAVAVAVAAELAAPHAGSVRDEAKIAGREANTLLAADDDYFHDMDWRPVPGREPAGAAEIRGRDTWIVWTGGNDRFWDSLTTTTFGNFDLLKILSSYPGLKFSRDNRWTYLGLVNEPCFEKPAGPDPKRFGLWLDKRSADCPPDPFENEAKYPGVKIGARGSTVPVSSYYGYASGIVGLRLFPNPAFDKAAQRKWDPVRYYTDPSYYNSAKLVRPYRVGMSCAFCHIGPSPTNPPQDPEHPNWSNLSGTVGNQYFWIDRIFSWQADSHNYLFQLLHTSRPGALDTSLVSTDYINNPRTMNAVYNLSARLKLAQALGRESLSRGNLKNMMLPGAFAPPNSVYTPHVLKDGADSVGALGALNRVYLNIGLFSEEWTRHFTPFLGLKQPSPIRIEVARRNSSYWNATEAQTRDLASYLIWAGAPDKLADAPGGRAYLTATPAEMARGETVFAERCARCHSSKLPALPAGANPQDCAPKDYLTCWNRFWSWTKTESFKAPMRQLATRPDFLDGNFLSTDIRVPVTLLQTNLCSPLATNAIEGKIWGDFSSSTYKQLPSAGQVTVMDPITGRLRKATLPDGGRGYTRPASLISLWATSPYLLNNSVGRFEENPDVASRMQSFDDAIHQMLWPETRPRDPMFPQSEGRIDRLPADAYLFVPSGYLPDPIAWLIRPLAALSPDLFVDETHSFSFKGDIAAGSLLIKGVHISEPLSTFSAGAAVSGPGLPQGARVVRYDAAAGVLAIDRPTAQSVQGAALNTRVAVRGARIGPLQKDTPVNLLAAVELTPDSSDLMARARQDIRLADLLLGVEHDARAMRHARSPAAKAKAYASLEGRLYKMSKCPDYIVNRGHYFGTSMFPEEPALSDQDKQALISYLKTF